MLRIVLRGLRSHVLRLGATMLAIVLAVGFMVGTQVLGATIRASFDEAFADINVRIDAVVRSSREFSTPFGGQRARVDDDVLARVLATPGVAGAAGEVRGLVRVVDSQGRPVGNPESGPPTFGIAWVDEPRLNGWELTDGVAPAAPDDIVVDVRTARELELSVGDEVIIDLASGPEPFDVVGVARFGELENLAGAPAVLLETATAQELLGEPGTFDWISVAADDGIDEAALVAALDEVLGAELDVTSGADFTEESAGPFRDFITQFTAFINAFGVIALFVGGFIIFNTFAVLVAQRTRELALLRAIGASRRQVLGSVVVEAALVGVVAASIGVGFGLGLAIGLRELLDRIGFALPSRPLDVEPVALVWPLLLAVAVTVISALIPAVRASRVAPVAAVGAAATDRSGTSRLRLVLGALVLLATVALVVDGLGRSGDAAFWRVGGALIAAFVATAVLGPLVVGPVVAVLGAPLRRATRISGRLATENARRNPARTSITASALTIGVGLVTVIAIAASSASASITDATESTFDADLVVRPDSFLGLPPEVALRLDELDDVAVATGFRFSFGEVAGSSTTVIGIDPARVGAAIDFDVRSGSLEALGPTGVALSEREAERLGLGLGDLVPMGFVAGGDQIFEVVAIFGGDPLLRGRIGVALDQATFDALHAAGERRDRQVVVLFEPGVDLLAARAAVEGVVADYPGASAQNLAEITRGQTDSIDQAVAFLYALLFLAVLIALIGVVNTLVLAVYERTRELGLLRAVGMARTQVRGMIVAESVVIALFGTLVGLVIGVTFGRLLYELLVRQTRTFTTFALPTGQLVATVVIGIVAGVAAALYPAWRAARLDVLEAIATE